MICVVGEGGNREGSFELLASRRESFALTSLLKQICSESARQEERGVLVSSHLGHIKQ